MQTLFNSTKVVGNSPHTSSLATNCKMVQIGSSSMRYKSPRHSLLVQFSVAVLVAVRFQLSCILVRQTAKGVPAATHSNQITYATLCGLMRPIANPRKTDSKSAEGNLVGVRPPPGTKILQDLDCFWPLLRERPKLDTQLVDRFWIGHKPRWQS
jgi:hypothetical protein